MSTQQNNNGVFHEFFKDVWNVPNALTMLRLLLIPIYLVVHAKGQFIPALIIFLAVMAMPLLHGSALCPCPSVLRSAVAWLRKRNYRNPQKYGSQEQIDTKT